MKFRSMHLPARNKQWAVCWESLCWWEAWGSAPLLPSWNPAPLPHLACLVLYPTLLAGRMKYRNPDSRENWRTSYRHVGHNVARLRHSYRPEVDGVCLLLAENMVRGVQLWDLAAARVRPRCRPTFRTDLRLQLLRVCDHRQTVSRRLAQSLLRVSLSWC